VILLASAVWVPEVKIRPGNERFPSLRNSFLKPNACQYAAHFEDFDRDVAARLHRFNRPSSKLRLALEDGARLACQKSSSALVHSTQNAHTPTMNIKNAAFLALIGMVLLTILLVAGSISDVLNVVGGLVPATTLLKSFIYAFAGLSASVFFFVFYKSQG